uniref:Uncharacterized protein n=1 Tax=Trichobilharzia regenti TaxID=157069 RepID=A0AA85IUU5_TRIRE|nr:unnamed protein product [Trichobilharzia regenti]
MQALNLVFVATIVLIVLCLTHDTLAGAGTKQPEQNENCDLFGTVRDSALQFGQTICGPSENRRVLELYDKYSQIKELCPYFEEALRELQDKFFTDCCRGKNCGKYEI